MDAANKGVYSKIWKAKTTAAKAPKKFAPAKVKLAQEKKEKAKLS